MNSLSHSLKLFILIVKLNWKTLALAIAIPTILISAMFAFSSEDWYSFRIQMKTGIPMILALIAIAANIFVYQKIIQPRMLLFTLPTSPGSKFVAYFLFILLWSLFIFIYLVFLAIVIGQPMSNKLESIATILNFSLIYGLGNLQPIFRQSKISSCLLVLLAVQLVALPLAFAILGYSSFLIPYFVSIFLITIAVTIYSIFKNDNLKAE